jgi:hypothetical protein
VPNILSGMEPVFLALTEQATTVELALDTRTF